MPKNKKKVQIFTDGACSGNPGPGGYGVILKYNGQEKVFSGGEKKTTNNRMELTAVIVALKALNRPCNVELYSDSTYVTDSINKGWLYCWQKNNWLKSNKKKVLNIDLWEQLLKLLNLHNVIFIWIKGHNEHNENERCDQLAVQALKNFIIIT